MTDATTPIRIYGRAASPEGYDNHRCRTARRLSDLRAMCVIGSTTAGMEVRVGSGESFPPCLGGLELAEFFFRDLERVGLEVNAPLLVAAEVELEVIGFARFLRLAMGRPSSEEEP
ncbi:MAG TPA: hypothetical protein VH475_05770 [Tepidisphaeraceae bacterium]|jgi:hypothetical protein